MYKKNVFALVPDEFRKIHHNNVTSQRKSRFRKHVLDSVSRKYLFTSTIHCGIYS